MSWVREGRGPSIDVSWEVATFVERMMTIPTTDDTSASAASGHRVRLHRTAKTRATETTNRKKAESPRDVHDRTAR